MWDFVFQKGDLFDQKRHFLLAFGQMVKVRKFDFQKEVVEFPDQLDSSDYLQPKKNVDPKWDLYLYCAIWVQNVSPSHVILKQL